jgi:hypothetical protein
MSSLFIVIDQLSSSLIPKKYDIPINHLNKKNNYQFSPAIKKDNNKDNKPILDFGLKYYLKNELKIDKIDMEIKSYINFHNWQPRKEDQGIWPVYPPSPSPQQLENKDKGTNINDIDKANKENKYNCVYIYQVEINEYDGLFSLYKHINVERKLIKKFYLIPNPTSAVTTTTTTKINATNATIPTTSYQHQNDNDDTNKRLQLDLVLEQLKSKSNPKLLLKNNNGGIRIGEIELERDNLFHNLVSNGELTKKLKSIRNKIDPMDESDPFESIESPTPTPTTMTMTTTNTITTPVDDIDITISNTYIKL